MPYQENYILPELALSHNDVDVYHAYKDDRADHLLTYWFTLDETEIDEPFDVRKLKAWEHCNEDIDDTLRKAIEDGELISPH